MSDCNCNQTGNTTPQVRSACNPCNTVPVVNSIDNESLPSQIENFTEQFFGEVIKTEVNGEIVWSLPCGLDTGLPNNPRGTGEGLACYFLRLFSDGIVGLTGPAGPPGTAGEPGNNAYTVTLHSFAQPSTGESVQVDTSYNPAIVVGLFVFVQTSGWYAVDSVDPSGTLTLRLTNPIGTAPATILAGRLVVPSGYPGRDGSNGATGPTGPQGASVKGDKGDKGDTGLTGPPGPAGGTAENGFYFEEAGTDYVLTDSYADVDFTASTAELTLGDSGTYLITAVLSLACNSIVSTLVTAKLVNATAVSDIPVEQSIAGFSGTTNLRRQIVINAIASAGVFGTVIRLQAKTATNTSAIRAIAAATTLTYVRLA